jgi:hypothetical protein
VTARGFAAAAFLLLAACGDAPAPPAKPKPAPPPVADPKSSVNVHQIMLLYAPKRPDRSHDQAFALAERLIARAKAGEAFETLIVEATDDLTEEGKPFNRGDYTISLRGAADPVFVKYVLNLKVGEIGTTPYDSGQAILVVRRDR